MNRRVLCILMCILMFSSYLSAGTQFVVIRKIWSKIMIK